MKILLFTPTYKHEDGSLAIAPACEASLKALDHGAHQVDLWISVDEHENKQENVIKQYQAARKRAMSKTKKYDALMIVEHDIILPPDALVKLADVPDADVVYGVYLFRHGDPVINAYRYVDSDNADQSFQAYPGELEKARAQNIVKVSGLGFGCILITRKVFLAIEFRQPPDGYYPDGQFANDCQRLKFSQYARFDVECGHIRHDGLVLWPRMQVDHVAVKILVDFHGNIQGESVPFIAGSDAFIPLSDAWQFQRAGFVSISDPQVRQ